MRLASLVSESNVETESVYQTRSVAGERCRIGASAGLVRIEPDSDVSAVLKAADAACCRAKEAGRDPVCEHAPAAD